MNLSAIHPGDRIEAKGKGKPFTAKVVAKHKGLLKIEPEDSRFTWRTLTPRAVVRRIDPVQTSLTERTAR